MDLVCSSADTGKFPDVALIAEPLFPQMRFYRPQGGATATLP